MRVALYQIGRKPRSGIVRCKESWIECGLVMGVITLTEAGLVWVMERLRNYRLQQYESKISSANETKRNVVRRRSTKVVWRARSRARHTDGRGGRAHGAVFARQIVRPGLTPSVRFFIMRWSSASALSGDGS